METDRMSWTWSYEKADATPVDNETAVATSFPTQADAETWIGENWRELLTSGVDQVTLLEDGAKVYGPMSLHPAE
jgi:hypothetical protein